MNHNIAAYLKRGEQIESRHRANIAVTDWQGKLLYSYGDPYFATYARSSIKMVQALQVVETGTADYYQFDEADLALFCASHNGEAQHTERVNKILQKIGLGEEALQCGTHPPYFEQTYKELLQADKEVTSLYHNCSGKHSGMLATAVYNKEDLATYLQLNHPVQQRNLENMAEMAQYPKEQIKLGVDGCGVPVFQLPLERLAYAFARMSRPDKLGEKGQAMDRITRAMMKYPEMVAGTDRFCSDFMRVMKGRMFGKVGAEAVYGIGDIKTGLGIAVKVEDGNSRALYPVVVEVLNQIGLLSGEELAQLRSYHFPDIKNRRNDVVGQIVPEFTLMKHS